MSASAYAWLFFRYARWLHRRVRNTWTCSGTFTSQPSFGCLCSISGCLRGIFRDNDARQGWPAEAKARANRILSSP